MSPQTLRDLCGCRERSVWLPWLWQCTLLSFVIPRVSEELLFSPLLLPHPHVNGPMTAAQFASHSWLPLVLFVAYHLLNPR